MPRVALIFAEEGGFRNGGAFSQLRNGTRVPREGFAAAKIFAEGAIGLRNGFAAKGRFRRGFF